MIDKRVDTVTSLDTYTESQSYFSANIVAEVAAGAAARITITISTAGSTGRRSPRSFTIPSEIRGRAM